jgi:hypothetical protein
VVHTSLYLPKAVHEALREIAFHERVKIHDLVLQGIDAVLKKRDYKSIEGLIPNRGEPDSRGIPKSAAP